MCGLQFFFVHLLKLFEIEGVNMDGSFMPFKHPVVSKAVCIYHIYIYIQYTHNKVTVPCVNHFQSAAEEFELNDFSLQCLV